MASTRMSGQLRAKITSDVARFRFGKRIQDMITEQAAFASKIYDHVFKDDLVKIKALPDGWLPEDDDICCRFGLGKDGFTRLNFNGTTDMGRLLQGDRYPEAINRRFPSNRKGQVCLTTVQSDPLTEEFEALEGKRKTLIREYENAKRDLGNALASFTTVGALIKSWPEIEQFASKYLDETAAARLLPVVPIKQLNTLLGLPPRERLGETA